MNDVLGGRTEGVIGFGGILSRYSIMLATELLAEPEEKEEE